MSLRIAIDFEANREGFNERLGPFVARYTTNIEEVLNTVRSIPLVFMCVPSTAASLRELLNAVHGEVEVEIEEHAAIETLVERIIEEARDLIVKIDAINEREDPEE